MDGLDSDNIFGSADSFLDFTQNIRPARPSAAFRFENAGSKCEVKHFDAIFNSKGDRVTVSSGARLALSRDRDGRSYESALVLTRYWTRKGDEDYTELEIRSPHMKAAIKAIVPEYVNTDIDTKHITLRDEPRPIFHYRDQLFAYGAALEPNSEAQNHISFLLEYMYQELSSEIYTWVTMVELAYGDSACLDFPNLWMLFRPGDLVYLTNAAAPTVTKTARVIEFQSMSRCKCDRALCTRKDWTITGWYIDYNGNTFGYRGVSGRITYFDGLRAVKELPILPIRFHPDEQSIRATLTARGKKFTELHCARYLRYKGVAEVLGNDRNVTMFGEEDEFPLQTTWIDGRVMVDCKTFCEARPSHEPWLDQNKNMFQPSDGVAPNMTSEEYMICHHMVAGFAFNEKRWGFFEVDFLDQIDYNTTTFQQSLILDDEYKKMIQALVEVHQDENAQFDDVITGKGKGLTFLLHGEPGTGKTLTAESLADHCKKPLLRIDASLLGTTARSVEEGLAAAFQLAERWKAVALLDEADVFLEQRTASDLERNSLVSVFLRMIEYYEGLLFLTTNRIESFDRAFKSRIHLAIHFPKLDRSSRRQLWTMFLTRAVANDTSELLNESIIDDFAKEDLNGRQIKNIVKVAKSLSVKDPSRDIADCVRSAIRAMKSFDHDFSNKRVAREGDGGGSGDEPQGASVKRRRIVD